MCLNFVWIFSIYSTSTKARTSASIILRGANDFMCDEMERSLHDALCVVKRVSESKCVVPGGGAVEAALSIYLENYATSMVRCRSACRCWELWVENSKLITFFLFFIPILFLGFPRAAGYCRVCAFPSRHSQDAGCERSSGLHWPGGQAPSLPQRSSG